MADRFVPRSLTHKPKTHLLPKRKSSQPKQTFNHSTECLTVSENEEQDKIPFVKQLKNEETNATLRETANTSVVQSGEKAEQVDSDDDEVVYFNKNQRWPDLGEPVCIICGRYGEYICEQTEADVCSKECKAKNLYLRKDSETKQIENIVKNSTLYTVRNENELKLPESCISSGVSDVENMVFPPLPYSYKIHPEVASLSDSQVHDLRKQMEITVQGEGIERPILEFSHCHSDVKLMENLKGSGYNTPTPIQMQVIPVALCGRDVLACAQTGSGKTAAFLIPMIMKIHFEMAQQTDETQSMPSVPKGLVLAPTRELCMQIERQAKELMAGLSNMKTALIVGGLPLPSQIYRLQQGVQVVFATPGRLTELIDKIDTDFSEIKMLVIDEVDVLMQMGFEQQVQSILESIPRQRQTLLFSATIPPAVEKISSSLLNNPLWISVGAPSAPNMDVKQVVLWVDDKSKKKRLFSLLKDHKYFTPPILVFVDSKMGADLLAEAVHKTCNICCTSMHGDKVQSERTQILESFLAGEYKVLVCTGIMGRGLDLRCVKQVINFDMPSKVHEYIHQVGRAGRLGSKGLAITFINNTNKGVFLDLIETIQPHGVKLPQELTNSPYLAEQQYARERKQKSRKRKSDECYVNRENLMDMLKKSTFRRRLKNR